jgi:hypothetical protein
VADFIKYKDWLKQTDAGTLATRSAGLKAVDQALLRHEQSSNLSNFDDLRGAFLKYIHAKGANWKRDVRNKYGAFTTLHDQVMGIKTQKRTGDIVAMSHLRNESRAILNDLFRGKQLEWRPGIYGKLNLTTRSDKVLAKATAYGIVKNVDTLSGGKIGGAVNSAANSIPGASGLASHVSLGPSVPSGNSMALAQRLMAELVPPEILPEVQRFLAVHLAELIPAFAASLTPFVGVGVTGISTTVSACKTLRAQYRVREGKLHQERSLAVAEPSRAIEGIIRLLERERNNLAAKTAIGAAEFGGKLAGVLADGGTVTNAAIGLAAQVAQLALVITQVSVDVDERHKANRIMRAPSNMDASVFVASPILGAYLVCCAPTSVLVNAVFDRFFERGWRGEVERNVTRHLNPLREQAQRLIKEHRFIIPSLQHYPGVMGVNKDALKRMEARKNKSGMVGFGSDTPVNDMPKDVQEYFYQQALLEKSLGSA